MVRSVVFPNSLAIWYLMVKSSIFLKRRAVSNFLQFSNSTGHILPTLRWNCAKNEKPHFWHTSILQISLLSRRWHMFHVYISPFATLPLLLYPQRGKKERKKLHSWTFGGTYNRRLPANVFSSSSPDQYNYPRSLLQITETAGGEGERREDCWPGKSVIELLHIHVLQWYLTILPNFWPQYCWGHI